jgi:regulator of sirC expression with transglutaminase-like and TPR domain
MVTMANQHQPQTFEELAATGEDLDVALGAALIAKDVYGSLDVSRLLARFDDLAAPLATAELPPSVSARTIAETISQHLYGTLGFAGNETEYYDPRNSLLPDVLDRRRGIPISLALVYCEVARRLGVRADGVSFPGHFLVRVFGKRGDEVLVDPFFGGGVLDDGALRALLERVAGQAGMRGGRTHRVTPEMLVRASGRAFLSRWLMNLRGIYLSRGDLPRSLLVVDRLVSLSPDDKALLRDRGMLAARLGANTAAREDLSRALEMDPSSETAAELRATLERLEQKPSAVN